MVRTNVQILRLLADDDEARNLFECVRVRVLTGLTFLYALLRLARNVDYIFQGEGRSAPADADE